MTVPYLGLSVARARPAALKVQHQSNSGNVDAEVSAVRDAESARLLLENPNGRDEGGVRLVSPLAFKGEERGVVRELRQARGHEDREASRRRCTANVLMPRSPAYTLGVS